MLSSLEFTGAFDRSKAVTTATTPTHKQWSMTSANVMMVLRLRMQICKQVI